MCLHSCLNVCFNKIISAFWGVRLKVTVKKREEMRQSIDLNRKKEQRGALVTVIYHGNNWRFDDTLSAVLSLSRAPNFDSRAQRVTILPVEVVASAQHATLDAEWLSASAARSSVLADVSQYKISPWAMSSRSPALCDDGISNSGCCYSVCAPTTKESEQRCCAAA